MLYMVMIILPISEFYEKLRYIIVNGVEKKKISNITADTFSECVKRI